MRKISLIILLSIHTIALNGMTLIEHNEFLRNFGNKLLQSKKIGCEPLKETLGELIHIHRSLEETRKISSTERFLIANALTYTKCWIRNALKYEKEWSDSIHPEALGLLLNFWNAINPGLYRKRDKILLPVFLKGSIELKKLMLSRVFENTLFCRTDRRAALLLKIIFLHIHETAFVDELVESFWEPALSELNIEELESLYGLLQPDQLRLYKTYLKQEICNSLYQEILFFLRKIQDSLITRNPGFTHNEKPRKQIETIAKRLIRIAQAAETHRHIKELTRYINEEFYAYTKFHKSIKFKFEQINEMLTFLKKFYSGRLSKKHRLMIKSKIGSSLENSIDQFYNISIGETLFLGWDLEEEDPFTIPITNFFRETANSNVEDPTRNLESSAKEKSASRKRTQSPEKESMKKRRRKEPTEELHWEPLSPGFLSFDD